MSIFPGLWGWSSSNSPLKNSRGRTGDDPTDPGVMTLAAKFGSEVTPKKIEKHRKTTIFQYNPFILYNIIYCIYVPLFIHYISFGFLLNMYIWYWCFEWEFLSPTKDTPDQWRMGESSWYLFPSIGTTLVEHGWLLCSPTFHGKVNLHMRYPLVI